MIKGEWGLQPTVPAHLLSAVSYAISLKRGCFLDHSSLLFRSLHVPIGFFLHVFDDSACLVTGAIVFCYNCSFNTSSPDSSTAFEHTDQVCLSCCYIPWGSAYFLTNGTNAVLLDGWMDETMNHRPSGHWNQIFTSLRSFDFEGT